MGGLNEGGLENELGQRGSMVRVVDRLLLLFLFPFSFRFVSNGTKQGSL